MSGSADPMFAEDAENPAFGTLPSEMLAAVLDQSVDCVKVLDPEGRLEFMNRNGLCAMEIDDFAAVAGKAWDALWPEAAREPVRNAVRAAHGGHATRFEAFCPTAKGTPRWWDVSVSPVRGRDGAVAAILSTSRDVTERRNSLERMETLAHEMRHRLRNAFAIGGAIVRASAREEPAHSDFAEGIAQRLQTLAVTQGSLLDPQGGEPLDALIGRALEAFGGACGRIALSGLPQVALDESPARLVALVIGELATNSLKHGALGAGSAVAIRGSAGDGRLSLSWRETSPLSVQGRPGSGLGLMERMARAHGGAFVAKFGDGGFEARLEMPLGGPGA